MAGKGVEKGYAWFKDNVSSIRIYQWCQLLFYKWLCKETFFQAELEVPLGFYMVVGLNYHFHSHSLPKSITELACNENYDSILAKLAHEFNPASLELDRSISGMIDSFLLATDTLCLRNQIEYKLFIATILAKEFYYHISVGRQGYDLQSMDGGGAKVIVEDFKKMAGYQGRHLEMLNSGTIMDFIK